MNSEIDITRFGSATAASPVASRALVSPPRRVFSRYLLPVLLLAGFAGVTAFAFRGAFVRTIDVTVTMPIYAPAEIAALAPQRPAASPAQPAQNTSHHANAAADTPAQTRENPPQPGLGKALFQAPGWIEPSPYPIVIPSLRPGTVSSIEVIEGQPVSHGTIVARLVDDDARLSVQMHESALRLKQARYDAALNRWKNPTSLVESIEIARAKGNQLAAQANRQRNLTELASIEANIGNTLSRSGYEPTIDNIRKETELSASRNQLLETHAEIALNSATLAAASERMRLRIEDREALETAEAELLEAKTALTTAQLALDRSIITAPTTGTIMRLNVSPGSMLSGDMDKGMDVAMMYKPDMLQVRADVPLAEAAKVRPGLKATISVEALPGRKFRGELVNIVPQFDLQKNILPVKVRIFDPDSALRPEMIARVEIFADQTVAAVKPADPVSAKPNRSAADPANLTGATSTSQTTTSLTNQAASKILMIPKTTVQEFAGKKQVLVVGPDNVAHPKEINPSETDNGMTLVHSGLRITDKIIISPGEVAPGRAVRIKGVITNVTN